MIYRNPLSDKRRFFLETNYTPQYELDEESIKDVSKEEIKARQKKLNQLLDWLAEADPTVSGKYAMWIAKLYKKELIQFPEDIEKIKGRLQEFGKVKHTLPTEQRDINRYKSYGELARILDEHSGVGVREAVRVATAEGQEVLFDHGAFTVIKVTTLEAASKLSRYTEWCIKDPTWGIRYLEWGPLYFIDKDNRRYALVWKGSCDKRYEQYEKFKKFVDDCTRKKICHFCQKPVGKCRTDHTLLPASEIPYVYEDFDAFNENFSHQALEDNFPEKFSEKLIPEHLKEFISRSLCENNYSILDVYDDRLSESDEKEIQPILIRIFEPDVAIASREELRKYYENILRGNVDHDLEEKLIKSRNLSKILDYLAATVVAAGADGRWEQIEDMVFKDPAAAARYYTILQAGLDENDKQELAKKGKLLPPASRPKPQGLLTQVSSQRRYVQRDLFEKQRKANVRIKGIRDRLRKSKKDTEARLKKIDAQQDLKYKKLQDVIDKAIEDAEKGKPIEPLARRILNAGGDYYGRWLFREEKGSGASLKQFVIDFVAYYNKGFIRGKKRKLKRRRRKRLRRGERRKKHKIKSIPWLYSGEDLVNMPSMWGIRRRRRKPERKRRLDKIQRKQGRLVAFANRKVAARKRRNPYG